MAMKEAGLTAPLEKLNRIISDRSMETSKRERGKTDVDVRPSHLNGEKDRSFNFVLLGASFGTANMGVAALASGTVAAIVENRPRARIALFDYGLEPANYKVRCSRGSIPVSLANIRFSKKFYLPNNVARLLVTALAARVMPFGIRRRLILRNAWLKILDEADAIGSLAGGDSFSDIYGLGRLIYVCLPQLVVLAVGKPLTLLPQTIGPFNTQFGRRLAKFILSHATRVYTRDRNWLGDKSRVIDSRRRVQFCYDVGFTLEPSRPAIPETALIERIGQSGKLIGLNISGLLLMGGYDRQNMFGLRLNYQELILQLVRAFLNDPETVIFLVPHVFGNDGESDVTAGAQIQNLVPLEMRSRVRVAPSNLDHHQIKYLIGQCSFFVGSRMHACIAALSQSVPTVSLSYSDKFAGVMESIQIGESVVDLRAVEIGNALAAVRRNFERRAVIRAHLDKLIPDVKRAVFELM
jgi:polysaccharide pyruvyl transferase WcaK-like protein